MNKKRNEEEKARKSALAESFWERTNTLIKQCGKTQREISLLMDKENPRKLQNWTAGKGLPDAEEVVIIAKALNTTVEYLVLGENDSGLSTDAIKAAKLYESIHPTMKPEAMEMLEVLTKFTNPYHIDPNDIPTDYHPDN